MLIVEDVKAMHELHVMCIAYLTFDNTVACCTSDIKCTIVADH